MRPTARATYSPARAARARSIASTAVRSPSPRPYDRRRSLLDTRSAPRQRSRRAWPYRGTPTMGREARLLTPAAEVETDFGHDGHPDHAYEVVVEPSRRVLLFTLCAAGVAVIGGS